MNVKYVTGGIAVASFITFVALAQMHVIFVPYFTPPIIRVEGLRQDYRIDEKLDFTIKVEGYGSNCHMLQFEISNEDGERMSFYRRADDCRIMTITHRQYDLARSFDYDIRALLGSEGMYRMNIQFEDLIDGSRVTATKSISVR